MPRRSSLLLPLLAAVAALTGCGSETIHELPPAAEPPGSPPAAVPAAGRVVRVGPRPEGIAADPRTGLLAVALRDVAGDGSLALVDPRRGRVVRRVALPGAARHVALARAGGPVLVPVESADRFAEVALPSGRVLARSAPGAHPHDATGVAGGVAAVTDERGDAVALVRGDRVTRRVRVDAQPGGVSALSGGRRIAVVSVRERTLEVLDAGTLRLVSRAPAGVGPTHVACLDAGPCFVADTAGGALLVYAWRGRTLALVRRVFLPGGPYGIALDAVHRRLYVTLPARNEVAELPAHGRPHVLRRWPSVRQPQSVAVDPRTGLVAVTGRDAGVVQLIRAR